MIFEKGTTLIVLGAGGVGKTTVAAVLSLAAAQAGLNTAVITVDPAQRLKDALGVELAQGRAVQVEPEKLRAAGFDSHLRLTAIPLDVRGTWKNLAERFTASANARERILSNPFYTRLAEEFAGSEAYATLEQLYELHQSRQFEVEIVDTPPIVHAFEFLRAPAKLAHLFEAPGAGLLFRPPRLEKGRIAARLTNRAIRFVARELERFTGSRSLSAAAEFFTDAADAIGGLVARFRKAEAMLKSPGVRLVLVTTAEPQRLNQTRCLARELTDEGLRLSMVVVNRLADEFVFRKFAGKPEAAEALSNVSVAELRRYGAADAPSASFRSLTDWLENYQLLLRQRFADVRKFKQELSALARVVTIPELDIGANGLADLRRLVAMVQGDETGFFPDEATAPPRAN